MRSSVAGFIMNMPLYRAARLIAVSAFALMVPTLAAASEIEQSKSFKLAMGPMSAAQKNQSQGAVANSDHVEIGPQHHIKPNHHVKHRRRHHWR